MCIASYPSIVRRLPLTAWLGRLLKDELDRDEVRATHINGTLYLFVCPTTAPPTFLQSTMSPTFGRGMDSPDAISAGSCASERPFGLYLTKTVVLAEKANIGST
jgi:hypothetical protein